MTCIIDTVFQILLLYIKIHLWHCFPWIWYKKEPRKDRGHESSWRKWWNDINSLSFPAVAWDRNMAVLLCYTSLDGWMDGWKQGAVKAFYTVFYTADDLHAELNIYFIFIALISINVTFSYCVHHLLRAVHTEHTSWTLFNCV